MIRFFAACALALPFAAVAAPVTYDELVKGSEGDASSTSLLGRTIEVNPKGFGELGFTTKIPEIHFTCGSGDKALIWSKKNPKPKAVAFYGVIKSAQGWEGNTVWALDNCRVGKIK